VMVCGRWRCVVWRVACTAVVCLAIVCAIGPCLIQRLRPEARGADLAIPCPDEIGTGTPLCTAIKTLLKRT
jgi:hypothetical protein